MNKTKSWSVPYERPNDSINNSEEIDIFYYIESGKEADSMVAEVKTVLEKHLVAYRDKAVKIVGEIK